MPAQGWKMAASVRCHVDAAEFPLTEVCLCASLRRTEDAQASIVDSALMRAAQPVCRPTILQKLCALCYCAIAAGT